MIQDQSESINEGTRAIKMFSKNGHGDLGGPKCSNSNFWSTANSLKLPCNSIAGRPNAALLFWFFSDFICGVSLFIVILVIYKYKNR